MLEPYGDITHIHIVKRSRKIEDPTAGIPAFVDFADPEAAARVMQDLEGERLEDHLESYTGDDRLVIRFPRRKIRNSPRQRVIVRRSRSEVNEYVDHGFNSDMIVSGPVEMDFSRYPHSPKRRFRAPPLSRELSIKRARDIPSIDFEQEDPEELELAQREYELLASVAKIRKRRLALRKARESHGRRRL